MKKLSLVLLSICLLAGTSTAATYYDFVVDDIYYSITSSDDLTVSVSYASSSYNSYTVESLTVPSTVTYNDAIYTVTGVGNHAFRKCTSLQSVTLPSTVTTIGQYSFYSCTSLTSVTLPDSTTTGVFDLSADANQVTSERYYTVGGQQVAEPTSGQKAIYIVVRTYSDGTTEVVKEVR